MRYILVFLAVCAIAAHAQSNASDAALEGYVRDPSGAVIAAAKVSVRNLETNIVHATDSGEDGYYRFPLLRVGTYKVTAMATGFKQLDKTGVNLAVGEKARIDFSMQLGASSETINVTADAPIAETGQATIGAVLSKKEVEDLPIASRNVYNYFLLAPGVQGLSSSTFGTTQFTFGGTERSSWNLDGLDNTQRAGNRQIRMVITTPEAVEQVQVLSNGYSAEFGRAAGGQVNLILKSGTNQLHGSGMFLYRFADLQARPSLAAVDPDRTWHDEAFTLGGPIRKDKIFFFGQFENNPYTLPNPITITPANAAALNLPAHDLGNAPFGETYRTSVAKVDYKINDRNTGYLRYNRFTNHQPGNASGLTITDRGNNFDDHMNGGGAQLATILRPNLLNELRGGGIARTQQNEPIGPPDPNGAYTNITGVANIGYNPLAKTYTTETSFQVVDNLTWINGRNTWKGGIDYQHTQFEILKAENRTFTFGGLSAANGRPAVSSLQQYLNTVAGLTDPATGNPFTYTQFQEDGGDPHLTTAFQFINFFLQDEFRVTPRFTLNLGVRYEATLFPELDPDAPFPLSRKIDGDHNDWAPRFGFTWSPFKDSKTVVRGAYGIYYDVPGLSTFYTAAQVNGHRFLSYQIAGTAPDAPVFPNVPELTGSSFVVPPSINAFSPGYHTPYQHQANFQIQREITPDLSLTVGYNFAAMRHGLYSDNINLGAPVSFLADGRPVYGGASARINPSFNQINLIVSGANTNYNALLVDVAKRFGRGLEFTANYTWSHALGNNLGEGGAPEDPSNLQRDYGRLGNDARHTLVFQGLYAPHASQTALRWINGFEVSTTFAYNSGFPINVTSGIDLNNDGVLNDRPLFRGYDDVTGPSMRQLDARLTRAFSFHDRYRLTAILETENLLNSTNASCSTANGCTGAVISTATAADFGRITSARTSRNVQMGLKFNF
ncbi:MAG TPA: TonB-dependent receptor [Bryobacteraceae bacterium]|nr:TonB-dependent receptor [Bryobacteraceae bacterium]